MTFERRPRGCARMEAACQWDKRDVCGDPAVRGAQSVAGGCEGGEKTEGRRWGGPRIRGGRRNAKCVPLLAVKMPLECHFMRTELVTTLKRKATEIIADLEQDHQPVLITQHGRPAAYLVDVESFEALNQRIAVLEGIARAEQAIEQGRVVSHAEAKNRMGRWLN